MSPSKHTIAAITAVGLLIVNVALAMWLLDTGINRWFVVGIFTGIFAGQIAIAAHLISRGSGPGGGTVVDGIIEGLEALEDMYGGPPKGGRRK